MANKTSCVVITPDLRKKYCEADNISENDLAVFFYEYLESKYTPNELTDKVLNSQSFKDFYNWYFKLGNSRFLIQTPSAYKEARTNWERMKQYGMDIEGYLTIDTAEKKKVLDWIKTSRDFETHFVSYTDLKGNTVLKVEEPIYVGKVLSDTQMKKLKGLQVQTIEDIQHLLKEEHLIHRFEGAWWVSKSNGAQQTIQKYIDENIIDGSKVKFIPTQNAIIVKFTNGDDLFFQKPDIRKIITENNRPIKALGSIKKVKEALKRSNLTPELRNAIIEAIEKNPSLREHSIGSLLSAMSLLRDKDILSIYNESIGKELDSKLDSYLMNYLKEFGFEINIGDAIKEFGDYPGVFDALNKVIYLANNRNKITAPEEFAHAFIKLLGKKDSTEYKYLYKHVEETEIYKQVYAEYSSIYTVTHPDGSVVPQLAKIKEEAIGQALAAAIVDKWETSQKPEGEKTWWDKLKDWVNSILDKFEGKEYISFDTLVDKLASDILEGKKDILHKKYDDEQTRLLDYVETIENQTKKDGGKALEFLQWFSGIGNVIAGSLSYRYQGTVYRPALDSIHDIDMEVPLSVHNFSMTDMEFNAYNGVRDTSDLLKIILDTEYFKKVKAKYPKMKFNNFVVLQRLTGVKTYFISGVYSENEELSKRFLELSGSYADRLNQFTEEERGQIYLFDFFLKDKEVSRVFDPIYNLNLGEWQNSMRVKIDQMGRDKDSFDYKKWSLFDQFKHSFKPTTIDLMFQKPTSPQTDYISIVNEKYRGLFEGGGSNIYSEFPNFPKKLADKYADYYLGGEIDAFTEEDAKEFLKLTGYLKEDISEENKKKLNEATVIWGHPGTGKTELFKKGRKDIIDFDSEYKVRINSIMGLPEGADAKELRVAARKARKQEYHDLIMKLFDEAKAEAVKTGRKLLVSDMMLLRERESDIDVITNMSDYRFLERSHMRDEHNEEDKMLWKNDINDAMNNVSDKSKIIQLDGFLSEALAYSTEQKEENSNPFEVGDGLYNTIRETFANKVAYSQNFKKDHVYLVKNKDGKWVPVDYSVSQVTEKPLGKDTKVWKTVATGIGNTFDSFMRDFFALSLKPSYPNLTKEQYEELKTSAEEARKYLNDLLGEGNYKVAPFEFPILGYIKEGDKVKTVAGTMDLLVYDKEGNFYIIDMKTKRTKTNSEVNLSSAIKGYSKQQYMYKNMLELAIPELRGRIKQPLLLVADVWYPSPTENSITYTQDDKGNVMATFEHNGIVKTVPITSLKTYRAPKFAKYMSTQDVENEIKELLTIMTEEEFETEYGTPKAVKNSLKELKKIVLDPKQSQEAAETEALYTIIPKEEVVFLGKNVAATFSSYLNDLLSDPEAKDRYFTNFETGYNPYSKYDFTKMSREELLEVPFLVENLLENIKEENFNPDNSDADEATKAKLNAAYVNFDALIKANYAEFIKLEGLTFNKSAVKTYVQDGIDPSITNTEDPAENEDNGREHWQLGIRNMSAMSGLSARLRRFLSTIEDIDAEGDLVADRFGYGLATTLDGNEVVNSLLMWLKDCNTLEEMETVLQRLAKTRPWINTLLDEIKNEPIRSQFFQCFRKDFTEYSTIITVRKIDQNTGLPYWETINKIINTAGAVDKVISEVKDAYFNRDIPIFVNGLIDSDRVTVLQKKLVEVTSFLSNKQNWETLKTEGLNHSKIKLIKGILNRLGIMFDEAILADLVATDENVVNFVGSKLNSLLIQAKYITDNLIEGNKRNAYDPFGRDDKNSVYNSYKNIAVIAEPYVTTALEASTYANGKMYYSFVSPSYMGQLFNNLINTDSESLEDYLQENYGKYTWFKTNNSWNIQWLKDIESNRDTLARKVQLSFEGTDYVDLGERAYTLSLLREFFYDQKNKTLAWYRIPTLSNKPSSEFIRNKRYTGDFRGELTNQIYNIFLQEIKRAQTVVERFNSTTITDADKIKNFDIKLSKDSKIKEAQKKVLAKVGKEIVTREDLLVDGKYIFEDSGASFKFLDGFVEDIKIDSITGKYIIDKVFNKDIMKVDDSSASSNIKYRIKEMMDAKVEAYKNYLKEIGLTNGDMNFMLSGDTITKKTTADEALAKLTPAIEEYVWNDFVATANIVQITTTDLAFYKDSVDFQKRYAQVHSPGLRLNKTATNTIKGNVVKVSDGYLRSMLIADKISVSNIKENVKLALDNHYNSMKEGPAKEEFKIMKDMIVSQFDEINEADAQAYTCPTAYMKKMVMAGEWNPLMQEAYERIKEGNYNISDLGVVWQPIKPFVYTQNGMNGHSTTSPYIKVPSQHKNSEYMLLIADALTRGDKQNNVLNAIMDFMESTHEKDGKYTQDGIDTIEFDSAVKVGVHGVIDINNLTAKEVKEKLENALKNEATIFKYPVEDYAIQQNVPAHFKEHSQPMGSQIRALILSDLTGSAYKPLKGKDTYTANEVNTVYQDLIARNVYRSWDKLIEELGINGDRLERNRKLSDLLLEEMSKDARYGADLRRAVMLDVNGEFVIPLDDPIHSSRLQQVVNSIVKSRINKQRTQGGPVVQASSFGLSNDLSIVFQDKNGKELDTITKFSKKKKLEGKELELEYKKYIKENQGTVKHFECYIPLPSGLFEELMLVDDGKGGKRTLSIEEATNPNSEYYVQGLKDCLNAIGYRIPTEDTYSMVPIKIAGFVPKAAGEVVMLPKEITLLSGSDFDIDKLYIMMPELAAEQYNRTEALKYYQKYVEPSTKLVGAIFEEEPETFKQWLKSEEGEQFKVARGIKRIGYKQLDPKSPDYKKQLDGMTKQQVNNAIFDLQWGVITNEASMIKLFNPGSFDVQKKASRIISIARSKENTLSYDELMKMSLKELDKLIATELDTEKVNILDAKTQTYFFKQNMTAGKLIGVFANANVSHVFCNLSNITVNLDIKFNGIPYKGAKWDPTYSATGRYVSKNIAGYVGASVDAVKDPVFANMNVNMNTVNAALILTRLGVNPEEIALLTSQPIVEEFSKRMDAAKDKSSFVDPTSIMRELLSEYGSDEEISVIFSSLNTHEFTSKELFDNIKNEDTNFSLRVGCLFYTLLEVSDDMKGITYCTKFNSITNAPGPLFTDNLYARERVNNFINKVEEGLTMFSPEAANIIKNNPIIYSIYKATIGKGNVVEKLASNYWKYYGNTFNYISKKVSKMLGRPVKGEILENIYQNYMLYCLHRAGLFNIEDNIELITKFPDEYIKTIRDIEANNPELYERELKHNPLIQRIRRTTPTDKLPISTLTMESGKMNGEVSEGIKNGWSALIESSNDKVRELGITLFFYNIYRTGFKFSPKTFLHLASTDVKYNIANYIDYITDNSLFELEDLESYNFILQYCRNYPDELLYNREEINGKELENALSINISYGSDIVINSSPFGKTLQPIIKYHNELYVAEKSNISHNVESVTYHKVSRLGIENDVVEYMPSEKYLVESKVANAIKKQTIKKPISSSLMSEGMTEKTSYTKNSGETPETVTKNTINTPTQITQEQLNNILATLNEDIKELIPLYVTGGILNTSMSVAEMIDVVMKNVFAGLDVDKSSIAQFEAMKQSLGSIHEQIINIIKEVC